MTMPASPSRLMVRRLSLLPSVALLTAHTALAGGGPCQEWNLVPTPDVGDSRTHLRSVTALAPDDAWIVGDWRNAVGSFGPLAMRWDGENWSLQNLPSTAHLGTLPDTSGVEATPNGEVWIVGKVSTGYPTNTLPLVLRWMDGQWATVDTVSLRPQTVYPFAARGGILNEAAALADDDIWAVGIGAGFGDGGATSAPLAVHWDGSSWTEADVPRVANRHHELTGVVAIASDDVWAVGDYRNVADAYRGVTYHWDGETWAHVPSPIEAIPQSGLFDVAATGPNDVWAIGSATDVGVVLMHWDGSDWSLATPPPNSGGSLIATGGGELWASGWTGFWRWDGGEWTEHAASVPGATYVIRNGGMEPVSDGTIWCVGYWTLADGSTGFSLAERLSGAGALLGDTNGDDLVDFLDLNNVLSQYNAVGDDLSGDVDGDGAVNFSDLNIVISNYNASCQR